MTTRRTARSLEAPWLRYVAAEAPRRALATESFRVRCALLAQHLHARGWVTEAELRAHWPGGAENPDRGPDAWVHTHFNYARFMGRAEDRYVDSEEATQLLRRAVADALADKPEYVELTIGRLAVYPKSYHALEELDALDGALEQLARVDWRARALETADVTPLFAARECRSLTVRLWAWIITHPSGALPYTDADDDPTPPAQFEAIAPDDLFALWHAYRRVNRRRNEVLLRAFPLGEGSGTRLRFDGFLGSFVDAKGLDGFEVLRRWPLGRVLATTLATALAADAAKRDAEAKRAQQAPASPAIHAA